MAYGRQFLEGALCWRQAPRGTARHAGHEMTHDGKQKGQARNGTRKLMSWRAAEFPMKAAHICWDERALMHISPGDGLQAVLLFTQSPHRARPLIRRHDCPAQDRACIWPAGLSGRTTSVSGSIPFAAAATALVIRCRVTESSLAHTACCYVAAHQSTPQAATSTGRCGAKATPSATTRASGAASFTIVTTEAKSNT